MFHWLLWGHMSHPEPIIVFWAVRLGLAGCATAALFAVVQSAPQEPHGLRVGERWILKGEVWAFITGKRNGYWVAKQLMILVSSVGQQQIAGVHGFGLESWFLIPAFLPVKLHTPKPMFPTGVGVCRKLQCFMFFLCKLNVFNRKRKNQGW